MKRKGGLLGDSPRDAQPLAGSEHADSSLPDIKLINEACAVVKHTMYGYFLCTQAWSNQINPHVCAQWPGEPEPIGHTGTERLTHNRSLLSAFPSSPGEEAAGR